MRWRPLTALAIGLLLAICGALILLLHHEPDWTAKASWAVDEPSGPVRFCGGADVSNSEARAQREYNQKFAPASTATFSAQPFDADLQHDRYVQLFDQGSDECDVIVLDVIYMKEFAANHRLYEMTPYLDSHNRRARFDPRMMGTVDYAGGLWGVPKQLDVGVMYYRSDRVPQPVSWKQVYDLARPRDANDTPGLRVQVGPYEGLTVLVLELAYAAGAHSIVSPDGTIAQLDQPSVLEALRFLRDAKRDRVIPQKPQKDLGNLGVYELGRAAYLRGWPFVGAQIHADAYDAHKGTSLGARAARRATDATTRIAQLPPWKPGGTSVGVLGGHNLVIPRTARHPQAALRLIDFMTSDEQVRKDVQQDSQLPVLRNIADEGGLGNLELMDAVDATSVMQRPSLVRYAAVSTVISCGVSALLGEPAVATRAGLAQINRDVQRLLDGGPTTLKVAKGRCVTTR